MDADSKEKLLKKFKREVHSNTVIEAVPWDLWHLKGFLNEQLKLPFEYNWAKEDLEGFQMQMKDGKIETIY